MRKQKSYKHGDKIGYYQLEINREVEPYISPSGAILRQYEVICPKCGNVFVAPQYRLNATPKNKNKKPIKQCPSCSRIETNTRISSKGKETIKDLTGERFGKLVVLEPTNKREQRSVVWKCQCDCGNIIECKSIDLTRGHTKSCGCLKSKGELLISKLLTQNDILFEYQKTFHDCLNPEGTNHLYFDFFLPEYQCCIEYDGKQHFEPVEFFGGLAHYQRVILLDTLKEEYCVNHGLRLVRIPYTDYPFLNSDYLLAKLKEYL